MIDYFSGVDTFFGGGGGERGEEGIPRDETLSIEMQFGSGNLEGVRE